MKSPTTDKVIDRLKQPYCMGFVRMKYKHPEKQKSPRQRSWAFKLAGELGFEPRQTVSETVVLPLDDSPLLAALRRPILTLGVLWTLTCFTQAELLTLNFTGITSHEASLT